MGINVIGNTGTQELILPTGSVAISSGDLVVNAESGYAATASSALTIAQNNNTTAGPVAITAMTQYSTTNYYGFNDMSSAISEVSAQLSTGDVVFAVAGNGGSSASTALTLNYRNLRGGVPYPSITVTSSAVAGFVVRRITNVGVAVIWNESSSLKFAIYSNTGSTVKAATTVSTLHTNSIQSFNAHVLVNGNLVIAYDKVTSRNVAFTIYDTTGTIVGTEVTVESAASAYYFCVRPQSNGNFVVYYFTAAANGYKFARYNSSGTLQGTLTTVASITSSISGVLDNLCVELNNGNLLFISADGSNRAQFSVYSASGVIVKSSTGLYNNINQSSSHIMASTIPGVGVISNGFILASRGSSNSTSTSFAIYDNSGANLQSFTTTSGSNAHTNTVSGGSNWSMRLIDLGNVGFAIINSYWSSGCANFYYVDLSCFTYSGTRVGSLINLMTSTNGQIFLPSVLLTQDGSLFFTTGTTLSSGAAFTGTYAVQRKSVIGVAQENIPANSSGRVATSGTFTLNNSYVGARFDQRTADVPGTRGVVVGNSVVLFGMS